MVEHHQQLAQSHEELCPLVVVHLCQLFTSRHGRGPQRDQKVWDAVNGPLGQGLVDIKVLGEGQTHTPAQPLLNEG